MRAAQPRWSEALKIPEMWAGLSIITMWLAVLFDAVFGPDFVSQSVGGDTTRIPSALFIALFAMIATMSVGKIAFVRDRR